jgi:DNA-binding NarL/FixJ family response regulator
MTGGTLLVSRDEKNLSFWKRELEKLGFQNVNATGEEKDSLNMVINEYKPKLLLIGSCFYKGATPLMMRRLLKDFPRLNIAAVNIHEFPDDLAPFFIWYGIKSYVNQREGMEEFYHGMEEVRKGHTYIAPNIKRLIDSIGYPEMKDKADDRQMEVLILLCNGLPILDIAGQLHISKRTVDWHIKQLCNALDVNGRDELQGIAHYLDLVTKDDLCFFARKKRTKALPKWAVVKQKTSRKAG